MLQKKSAKDLRVGMFVADLDRPWMDTPFLLQGFMLETADQVAQMQNYCQWAMVDPARSVHSDFEQNTEKKDGPLKRDRGGESIVVVRRAQAANH